MTTQELIIVAAVCIAVIFATNLTVKVAKFALIALLIGLAYYGLTQLGGSA